MGFFAASDGAKLYFSDSGVAGAGVALLCLAGLTRNSRDFPLSLGGVVHPYSL